jgi:hypothetical protein
MTITSLNYIHGVLFVIAVQSLLCEVGTEFSNITEPFICRQVLKQHAYLYNRNSQYLYMKRCLTNKSTKYWKFQANIRHKGEKIEK